MQFDLNRSPRNRFLPALLAGILIVFFPLPQHAAEEDSPVAAEILSEAEQIAPGSAFRAGVRIKPEPGWRVFGEDPGLGGMPLEITWHLPDGVEAGPLHFPEGEFSEIFGEEVEAYDEPFLVWSEIRMSGERSEPLVIEAELSWMAFDENEFLESGDTRLQTEIAVGDRTVRSETDGPAFGRDAIPAPAAPETAPTASAEEPASLWVFLFGAFLGGLILNLMPCVFPILGIKIMGFVNQAGEERGRIVGHGFIFTAGVLVSFWILAGILIALRAGGQELGWGFQLQEPAFVLALTVILLVFGLSLSGVFEIGLSAVGVGSHLTAKSGMSGSFFSGVLATVVATPCAAPFLAPALGAALTLPAFESIAVFTAIGVGLAFPYLALSAFPGLVAKLPRPGAWMESLKQFLAFLLYGTVAYLLWILADQVGAELFLEILFALVVIAMACWIFGRWSAPHRRAKTRWIARAVAAMVLVAPLLYAWNGLAEEEHRRAMAERVAAGEAEQDFLIWEPWSEERENELRDEGRFVYVDFTARWCATCQVNKRAYDNDDVIEAFLANDVALLRADWTNQDPEITRALAAYNRSAVPFNVLYTPHRDEPVIFPELFGSGTVLEKLEEAGATL